MVELLLAMERIGVRFPLAAPKINALPFCGRAFIFLNKARGESNGSKRGRTTSAEAVAAEQSTKASDAKWPIV